jgi:hypothetical protein
MKILYIGHYNDGSTSKMRGEYLKKILQTEDVVTVNADIPILQTPRIFRSLGWRFKIGPLIHNINKFILATTSQHDHFDLTWIDKGVFIRPELIRILRSKSTTLVHFTPDPAFTYHQSKLFYQALPYYDHCITTKSFEIADYKVYQARSVIFCTPGYDPKIHRPFHGYAEKRGVVFVGHREDDREEAISALLERNIPVKLAGINWGKLVSRYKNNPNLEYHGTGVFGEAYAQLLSGSLLGLGFLSKIVPEKHTTRTFEIPACGTALVTERNEEIAAIYQDDEVIFFDNLDDMVQKTVFAYFHPENLKTITEMGYMKVLQGPYSYESILQQIIAQIELPNFKINQ